MTKKRYTSEAEILSEIDAVREQVATLRLRASVIDSETDKMVLDNVLTVFDLDTRREAAQQLRHEALRLEREKLTLMGEALSEFRTEMLPALKDDGSVPRVGWRKMKV